ncbi:MAG TPA: fibronectin type III domain-containing protein [Candidatus Thermoplasmatota archaeon]|nr:fibronectin type III domain-containing protein [Candidatus Thermoplasmatota archaeon]
MSHTLKSRKVGAAVAAAVAIAFALAAVPGASANPHVEPNHGTIKIHQNEAEQPPQRNVPHVSCEFYVEGFNMADNDGTLVFYAWPPTGDMTVAMVVNFTGWAETSGQGYHFLEGPLSLPAGHYKVEAVGADEEIKAKSKVFWVKECPTEEPPMEYPCPTNLQAQALSTGDVKLTWTPAPDSTGTVVYRATGEGDLEYLAHVDEGVGVYVDSDTEVGVVYTYQLVAVFGDAASEDCAMVEVTAIPNFPTLAAGVVAVGAGVLAYAGFRRRQA